MTYPPITSYPRIIETFRVATMNPTRPTKKPSFASYRGTGTSDQLPINAAIQATPAGGAEVELLDGEFSISSFVNLFRDISQNSVGITLRGQGEGTCIKLANGSSGYLLRADETGVESRYLTIKDLVLDGNFANCPSVWEGIYVEGGYSILVENVHIINVRNGINIVSIGANGPVAVERCEVTSPRRSGILVSANSPVAGQKVHVYKNRVYHADEEEPSPAATSIYLRDVNFAEIVANEIVGRDTATAGTGSGDLAISVTVAGQTVEHCIIERNSVRAATIETSTSAGTIRHNSVRNNIVVGGSNLGGSLSISGQKVEVNGNRSLNSKARGIAAESVGAYPHIISDNRIINAAHQGLDIRAARSIIKGNHIEGCGYHGISYGDVALNAAQVGGIIADNVCYANSQSLTNTYSGIYIWYMSYVSVEGNSCFDAGSGTRQKYGIESLNSDYLLTTGNILTPNGTGAKSLSGANNTVANNIE